MSNAGALAALEYEAESSWGEDVGTFATHRLPMVGTIDLNVTHEKLSPDGIYQRRMEGSQWVLGAMGGSFTFRMDLPGHGATTSGSPSVDAIETFLGLIWGNQAVSLATSQTLTGGTAAAPTTSGASGVTAGGLVVCGALGDGDGDAQMYPVSTHGSSTLNLDSSSLRGAPVNGAVLLPVWMIYPSSAPTSNSITGTRFRVLTGNLQYELHGCFPQSVSITGLSPGERPQLETTWGVSWWEYSNGTFPSTVTSNRYNPAIIAAGSLHVQTPSTTTRNERICRSFAIDYKLGVQPMMGPAGVNAYQTVVGATRIRDEITVTWTEDADTVTTSPVLPGYGTATNSKLVMWTGSTARGSSIGILLRNVCITNVAIQKVVNNINTLEITGAAYCGSTTTSALTLAPFVLGFA